MKRIQIILLTCICAVMQMYGQVNDLERCTPESQGVPSDKITALQLHFVNWMSAVNLVFDFQDDQMHVDFQVNFDSPTKIMRKKLTPLP